ncbi:MAG: CHAD domain-containing protein [Gammaproteobacteria bacterium]|nr:CHAD domain-containing protein [Gammaproteobacteria bacterium]NND59225.1 CHAD domain-containing protein [Gammaproteobacteria bacterium]
MSEHGFQFVISPRDPVETLKIRLLRTFPLVDDGEMPRRRQFYDTFDWRLYGKGLTLEEERTEQTRRIVMRDLRTGAVQRWAENLEMPRFAEELPRGPFRERLASIIEMRALLPVTEVRTHTHQLRLRDREDKTVARVEIELAAAGFSHLQRLGKRLQIVAVRGHPDPANQLAAFATEHLHLEPASNSLLDEALASHGRTAQDYSSQPAVDLDPREPAHEAVRRILLRLAHTIEVNVQGTREHVDTEYLHDLRVAVRRTRSMIGQLRSVFDRDQLRPYRDEFRWLGGITGPCRDLDVYLLAFDDLAAILPASQRAALEPFRAYLQKRHVEEQRRLSEWLTSTRFRSLMSNWRDFLVHPGPLYESAPDAKRKLKKVADERIWHAYQVLRDRGRAIKPKTKAARVHRLRIHAKKLRYLMEFFRGIYPRKKIGVYVGALKRLQQNLGDFHDYHVQADALRKFAAGMAQEGPVDDETLRAIEALARGLGKKQKQARKQFHNVFDDFDQQSNRALARELFRPGKKKK